jgi:hypothetical protein
MNRRWIKLGQLYEPNSGRRHPKLLTHAANPLPLLLHGNEYRIFFSGRDSSNRSSIGAVDINLLTRQIVKEYNKPFFEFGPSGSFFESGVSIGNCYQVGELRYMLFMGWQHSLGTHWRGDIGRLIVNSDLTLKLDSKSPFMTSNEIDPISLSYPWVEQINSGGYRMWYGSTVTWDAGNGEMLHVINTASSNDGHTWNRQGLSIPYILGEVQAFSRPTVFKDECGGYEMWFSYRSGNGERYRIGYAKKRKGEVWKLDLEAAGIGVSASGWDSEMIEYPYVFAHDGQRYMLYNGNDFGYTGIGLAVLSEH